MRRTGGRETWNRLREWDKGQGESERLATRLLPLDGYSRFDPAHPLGGRDGGKDATCEKDGKRFVIAVYFPRGQKDHREIVDKFKKDLTAAQTHNADGFIFFTNQELTLSERAALEDSASSVAVDIYHLERIACCLDAPSGYGLRLEFLSIEMTKEEQVSFFNDRDQVLSEIRDGVSSLVRTNSIAEKKKPNAEMSTVVVQQHNDWFATTSLFGSKLVACKKCDEVFRAQRSALGSIGISSELETVKCPACGKVQAFRG